jgi:hypothetical protein
MSQFEKKSVNNGNLAILAKFFKTRPMCKHHRVKRPWGKKTTGYSIPQGKTKSTKTTSSGRELLNYSLPERVWLVTFRLGMGKSQAFFLHCMLPTMSVALPLAGGAGEAGQRPLLRRYNGQVGGQLGGQCSPLSHAQHRRFLPTQAAPGHNRRVMIYIEDSLS